MDRVERASQKSVAARRRARRHREREKQRHGAHVLGDGDRRRLRKADARQSQDNLGRSEGRETPKRGRENGQRSAASVPAENPEPVSLVWIYLLVLRSREAAFKDEADSGASRFETHGVAVLLTMRFDARKAPAQ